MRKKHQGVSDQRKASIQRLDDAMALFDKKRWRGSMYMAGYSVECRLKYVLMRAYRCRNLAQLESRLQQKGLQTSAFTHNLETLFDLTRSLPRMRTNRNAWRAFTMTNQWMPAWRYSAHPASAQEAEDFLDALKTVLGCIEGNLGVER